MACGLVACGARTELLPIDVQPPPDAVNGCFDTGAAQIYLVTEGNELLSYSPPTGALTSIGLLSCPTTATPLSMAVDRSGTAFVLFGDGTLFRVSTATAACTATPYVAGQGGFTTFGMGFTGTSADGGETLYVADNAGLGLASIDTTRYALSFVGKFAPNPIIAAELTGTGDGRLFTFYLADNGGSEVTEIDPASGNELATTFLPTVSQGSAWAFAFWGGDFYLLTALGFQSSITRFRPSDGSVTALAQLAPDTVIRWRRSLDVRAAMSVPLRRGTSHLDRVALLLQRSPARADSCFNARRDATARFGSARVWAGRRDSARGARARRLRRADGAPRLRSAGRRRRRFPRRRCPSGHERADADADVIGTDTAFPDVLPPLDVQPHPDVVVNGCFDAGATQIYLVTEENELMSYYPPTGMLTTIGLLSCPTMTASPFSMAVDRLGTAFVLFSDGSLFRVSTATAACISTPYVPGQLGFMTFGMGFSGNPADGGETLYVAGNTGQGLASIDTTSFKLSFVGSFAPAPILAAELTGTGDGRLFTFYNDNGGSAVTEVDPGSGTELATTPLPTVNQGSGWAFAFWGGDFYLFTAPGAQSTITRFRPSDGSVTVLTQLAPGTIIVGAGVSTCAPQ